MFHACSNIHRNQVFLVYLVDIFHARDSRDYDDFCLYPIMRELCVFNVIHTHTAGMPGVFAVVVFHILQTQQKQHSSHHR